MSRTELQGDTRDRRTGDPWLLRYEGFDPQQESVREALCTLGNGHLATRGAPPECREDGVHYPGTYVGGVYNRLSSEVAGRSVEDESMVNLPNWLPLTFRIEGECWFGTEGFEILEYVQELDLRRALLTRLLRVSDPGGRVTSVEQRRFVSMADPHLAGLEVTIRPENWSGLLTIRSGLDGDVRNGGVARYGQFDGEHLRSHHTEEVDAACVALSVSTSRSRLGVAEAARTTVERNGVDTPVRRRLVTGERAVHHHLELPVTAGDSVRVEKMVCLFTSLDRPISDPMTEARTWIGRVGRFEEALSDHGSVWEGLWRRFALEIEGCRESTELALHLDIFHLLQTVSPNTIERDVGVPARGLHGEAYRGHIFWDELFILPYLTLHLPALVRSLLLYRYRRLPEARWAARQVGLAGAMYPWQSGSDGREEAQSVHLNPLSGRWIPDASHLQRHIGSAIAYNVWRYVDATGDVEFLADYGAEMVFEIARFWASIASYDAGADRFEILGVMGPDEYHDGYVGASAPGLRNNSYTNLMAVWVLARAVELVELLPEPRRSELCELLALGAGEIARWDEISHKMRVVFHADGVISQFEGYEGLAELEWAAYRETYGDIARLDRILESEGRTANSYQASKQADVLMLLYLLPAPEVVALVQRVGYEFGPVDLERTVEYYLARTSHGSTLSRLVHGWVLSRSDRPRSLAYFEEALRSDLDDSQGGTTGEGVHLGAMAGALDLLQRCYLGADARSDAIWFDPHLPEEIRRLDLHLWYRGRLLEVSVGDGVLTVRMGDREDGTVRVGLGDGIAELRAGEYCRITL